MAEEDTASDDGEEDADAAVDQQDEAVGGEIGPVQRDVSPLAAAMAVSLPATRSGRLQHRVMERVLDLKNFEGVSGA